MALEITTAALSKVLGPILVPIAKSFGAYIKTTELKWDASQAIARLSNLVIEINQVSTFWSSESGAQISDFYYPLNLKKVASEYRIVQKSDLLNDCSIIEGIVGQGKSIFMRNLCSEFIVDGKIPIFIELRLINESKTLQALILEYLDSIKILGGAEVFKYLAENKKIALILDGFDELSSEVVQTLVYDLQRLKRYHTNLPIVVSSRPLNATKALPGFIHYALAPLSKRDHEPFLAKLVADTKLRTNIVAALKNTPEKIRGVLTTPLMMTLLCLVYKFESEIPESLPEFYDSLFIAVFARHDKLKSGFMRERYSGLPESKLKTLFDAFCFMVIQGGGHRTLSDMQFKGFFEKSLRYTNGIKCEVEGFRDDIVKVACLMLSDGYDQTTFLHKSILEYHAASFIKALPEDLAEKFYSGVSKDDEKWDQLLEFLRNIDPFKYGKFYVMRHYPSEIAALSALLESQSKEHLIQYFYEKLKFSTQVEGSSVVAYSVNMTKSYPFYSELIGIAIDIVGKAIDTADSKSLTKAIRASPKDSKGRLFVSFESAVKHLETPLPWLELRMIEQRLITALEQSSAIVENELSKFDLL